MGRSRGSLELRQKGTRVTTEGVDYSATAWSGSPSVAVLRAEGKLFVGLYAVNDKSPAGRGITAEEYARMVAGGIDVFLYWQTTTNWMLDGWPAGVAGAQNAQANMLAAGMPPATPVYFAVDFDAQPHDMAAIDDCLQGAASVLGAERVGVYGGWAVMDHCSNAGTAKWFCQTLAWMYGRGWHPVAHLHQYDFNAWIDGTNCDLVRATTENYGQASLAGDHEEEEVNPYAESVLPDWWAASLEEEHPTDRTEGTIKYHVARRNYVAKVLTTRRSKPDPAAPVSGPKVDKNEKLFGERIVQVKGETRYWVLTVDGHYVLGSKLSPKIVLEPW